MSKTKDELLSKLNEFIEKHGFVVDKETLDKSIKEYDVSSITDEELIKKCETVALSIYAAGKKGSDLIYELVGRYKNLIVTEVAKEYLEDTESIDERNNEEGIEKEYTIKTIKGDIPVRVITIDLDNNSPESNDARKDMVETIIKSFIDINSK